MNMQGVLSRFSTHFKIIATAVSVCFVGVLFVSIFAESFAPKINSNEVICLFDLSLECSETISEHITQWLHIVYSASQSSFIIVLATLLAFLATVLAIFIPLGSNVNLYEQYSSNIFLNLKRTNYEKWFNFLNQAFSNGILHPKLF